MISGVSKIARMWTIKSTIMSKFHMEQTCQVRQFATKRKGLELAK